MSDYIKMNRRDLFKDVLDKTKETSLKATVRAIGEYAELSDILSDYTWETVNVSLEQLHKPKMVMFNSKPYFVMVNEDGLTAVDGVCPNDGKMIYWQNQNQQYTCLGCKNIYDKRGKSLDEEKNNLKKVIVRENNGKVQFKIN